MTIWLDIAGRKRKIELPASATGEITCILDGSAFQIDARILSPGLLSLIVEGHQYQCLLDTSSDSDTVLVNGQRVPFTLDDPRSLSAGRGASAGAAGPRPLKAPMPGRVVRLLVALGDEVTAQQGLVVIEAMKMQNELKSPKPGRIARIAAAVGDTVQSGDILIVVE